MIRDLSVNTTIEIELPSLVTRLELISPFIFSKVSFIDVDYSINFELMSLEWVHEFRKLFNINLTVPAEYRTNLSPGGDDFHVTLINNTFIETTIYDQGHGINRKVVFTANELSALINTVYDQITEIFKYQNSSEEPINLDRGLTLEAFSAWQNRVSNSQNDI